MCQALEPVPLPLIGSGVGIAVAQTRLADLDAAAAHLTRHRPRDLRTDTDGRSRRTTSRLPTESSHQSLADRLR